MGRTGRITRGRVRGTTKRSRRTTGTAGQGWITRISGYYRQHDGALLTPDPYLATGGPAEPGSWNRYAYVEGDPVNKVDPTGLFWEPPSLMAPPTCWAATWAEAEAPSGSARAGPE
ncbi:MAG: hypothetical protein IPM24_19465 [Bryobacterales bacterium]|nr:hypothetical protein [Bryobacterales bacterium]